MPQAALQETQGDREKRKRSGSANRQRPKGVYVRFSETEYAELESRAGGAGLSHAAYLRATGLGDAGPRARRSPTVERDLAARAIAELNKAGSNLNQIARAVNMGLQPEGPHIAAAADAVKRAALRILRSFGYKTHDSQGEPAQ